MIPIHPLNSSYPHDWASHLVIERPNSCGQGYCPNHMTNPMHKTITYAGWRYSHTTRIGNLDGSFFAHHTYKFPGSDWSVGVDCRPGWKVSSHRGGSGYVWSMPGCERTVGKYLARKAKELRKEQV